MTSTINAADREHDLVAWARALGKEIAPHAARHDRDASFVSEAFALLKSSGYLALAVPEELGGRGATIRQVAMAQRELAWHCGSTALASAMHHHIVLFTAWRYRRGLPGAEATLRRVAEEGLVLVSTGGADFTHPRGSAVPTEGGYRVSGRKVFASQVPVGDVFSTMFVLSDDDGGDRSGTAGGEAGDADKIVLNMAVPVRAEGVHVVENWDTLGMRGTGSHDVEFTEVFVPEDKVVARRPYGVVDAPLQVIVSIAMPVISAVYLGVADRARDEAVALVAGASRGDDSSKLRQIGLMDIGLRVMGWALDGALASVGEDPEPSLERVSAVMAAKREIATRGVEVCDLALEVAGGAGFFRTSPIERCYRDVRAAKYHPFTPEQTLLHAGRVALGLPVDGG
ncbi:MAG: acyl-CoA dehydrogenase [Acidimicrobiia bacterium]|nr:acyl-CoA dehydrogenase [Acidimicrobiia bacterium]